MTISTKKPSKNLGGYTITFDANGGTFASGETKNEMVYSKEGRLVSGTYYKPTKEDGSFIGWYTKAKDGTEYKVAENGNPVTPLTEDITVYAHYKPTMKYAVAIYGIGVDDVYDEATGGISKGGLTFGPALGENYVQKSKSHNPSGTTEIGKNAHRCVHNDDWNTIIEWNKKDPKVYEQCIKEGCTHSVALRKNTTTTILSEQFDPIKETGDGPSTLYYELVTNNGNCYENLRWHPNGGSYGTNKDGWGATRIRAMLNGADNLTDKGVDNYSSYASSDQNRFASIYTADNCLFATFPKELQEAIGARQVKYDSVYDQKDKKNQKTTNDKLWLFSSNEVASTIDSSYYEHLLEGRVYEKYKETNQGLNNARRPWYVNSNTGNANGDTYWAWLRSSYGRSYYSALYLRYAGNINYSSAGSRLGVSVGFTLKR